MENLASSVFHYKNAQKKKAPLKRWYVFGFLIYRQAQKKN